jgi:hypothetical protein
MTTAVYDFADVLIMTTLNVNVMMTMMMMTVIN